MTNQEHNSDLKKNILEQIKKEHLTMRPRLYFSLKVVLLILVVAAALVVSIFIFNFIVFTIRINSHEALLGFGPRGLWEFLHLFPWPLLTLDLVLVITLEWLLRRFRFGYRIPVLYLLLGLFVVTVGLGMAFDRGTDVNDRFLRRADSHRLPPLMNQVYIHARRAMPAQSGLCKCAITAIRENTLTVVDMRGSATTTFTIVLPQNDPRATTSRLSVGDVIFIAGDREGSTTIRAFGVRKVDIRSE